MCINNNNKKCLDFTKKKIKYNISQIQFRREIVRTILTKYGTAPKIGGRLPTSIYSVFCNRVSDDVWYDEKEHFIIPTPQKRGEDVLVKDILQVAAQCAVSVMWGYALNVLNFSILQHTWV